MIGFYDWLLLEAREAYKFTNSGGHMSFKNFIEGDVDFPIQSSLPGMEDASDAKEISADDFVDGGWDAFHGRKGKHTKVRASHLARLMNQSRLNPGREYAILFKSEGEGGGGYWIVSRKRTIS